MSGWGFLVGLGRQSLMVIGGGSLATMVLRSTASRSTMPVATSAGVGGSDHDRRHGLLLRARRGRPFRPSLPPLPRSASLVIGVGLIAPISRLCPRVRASRLVRNKPGAKRRLELGSACSLALQPSARFVFETPLWVMLSRRRT